MKEKVPQILTAICLILGAFFIGYGIYLNIQKDSIITYGSENNTVSETGNSMHSLKPIISNQWYSTLYKSFPTNPLYAFPLSYKFTKSGLAVSYPTVHATEKTIFAGFDEDFTIGLPSEMQKPEIQSVGDWNVEVMSASQENETISTVIAQGMPSFTYVTNTKTKTVITSPKTIAVFTPVDLLHETKQEKLQDFVMKFDTKYYFVHLSDASSLLYKPNGLEITNPQKVFVALLDKPEHATLFQQYTSQLVSTVSNYTLTDKTLQTQYSLKTLDGKPVLTTLMLHQYNNLDKTPQFFGEYNTLRGTVKLAVLNDFTTTLPLRTPAKTFPKVSSNESAIVSQIKKDVADQVKEKAPDSKDYYLGTWLGKVSSLILLCNTYGLAEEKQKLIAYITPIYLDSLTYFSYAKDKTSLISTKPEFGNDQLNDHHFHYGYFIRLGAILIDEQAIPKEKIEPVIAEMIGDIANTDRTSTQYPFIRNFDVFEGHSWADGYGDTPDGNNQESSSEAINAWYSVYLWGNAIGDKSIENTGLYLYNTEITSVLQYWFNTGAIYELPYAHKMASIIWGGKVDFATWFSGKANMIYGIQLLPITPASDYLKEIPDFADYEKDLLASGGGIKDDWADLYLMWKSYSQKVTLSDIPVDIKSFDRDPKSLLIQILSQNTK